MVYGRFEQSLDNYITGNWGENAMIEEDEREKYVRIDFHGNEDAIALSDWKNSEMVKAFRKQFKGCFKVKDLKKCVENTPCDYAVFSVPLKVAGTDFWENWDNGKIVLEKGTEIYMFNNWVGSGTFAPFVLTKSIIINVNKWFGKSEYNALRVKSEEVSSSKDGNYNMRCVYYPTDLFYNVYGVKKMIFCACCEFYLPFAKGRACRKSKCVKEVDA